MTRAWWLNEDIRKVFDTPRPAIQWDVALLWLALIGLGLAELGFAVYGFYHAFEVFFEKVGLGG